MARQIELTTNIVIDKRLESYVSFFDHDWATTFGELSDRSALRLAAFDLTRDWKGIAVATRMPWLMIESLNGFHEGFTKTNTPFYKRLTAALGEYLFKDSKLSN